MSLMADSTYLKRELLNRKTGQNRLSTIQHKETKNRKYRREDKRGYSEKI